MAFKGRTNESHQRLGAKYTKIPSKSAREAFGKGRDTFYADFKLPYFDLVHGIIIDPMHNLMLGPSQSHIPYIDWAFGTDQLSLQNLVKAYFYSSCV